ncbi:MAG: hypothetical protein JWO84_395 [Parcubacteria group bacterium]|nr:hypothetical protein [Parcubacteria group bacterium]
MSFRQKVQRFSFVLFGIFLVVASFSGDGFLTIFTVDWANGTDDAISSALGVLLLLFVGLAFIYAGLRKPTVRTSRRTNGGSKNVETGPFGRPLPTTDHGPLWSSAYDMEEDIPALLERARANTSPKKDSKESWKEEPWYTLWSSLHHQGDIYPASLSAVPVLADIVEHSSGPIAYDFLALPASIEATRLGSEMPIPPELTHAYTEGIRKLAEYATAHQHTEDETFNTAAKGMILVAEGKWKEADEVLDPSEETQWIQTGEEKLESLEKQGIDLTKVHPLQFHFDGLENDLVKLREKLPAIGLLPTEEPLGVHHGLFVVKKDKTTRGRMLSATKEMPLDSELLKKLTHELMEACDDCGVWYEGWDIAT